MNDVMSDPHKWEFRPPPSGDVGEELGLCGYGAQCRLGELCPAAHSPRELEEWRERRKLQIRTQIQRGTYSDRILKEVLSEARYTGRSREQGGALRGQVY